MARTSFRNALAAKEAASEDTAEQAPLDVTNSEEANAASSPKKVAAKKVAKKVAKKAAKPEPKQEAPVEEREDKSAELEPRQEAPAKKQIAKREETTPAVPAAASAQIQGEVTADLFDLPYLNLAQRQSVGDLAEFQPGHFVFNNEHDLGTTIYITPITLRFRYEEATDYDSEDLPQRFETMDEVHAAGLTASDVNRVCDIFLVVYDPEEDGTTALQPEYEDDVAGSGGILAVMTVRRTAFKMARTLVTATKRYAKHGLHNFVFELASQQVTTPKYSWFVPNVSRFADAPEDVREYAESFLQG